MQQLPSHFLLISLLLNAPLPGWAAQDAARTAAENGPRTPGAGGFTGRSAGQRVAGNSGSGSDAASTDSTWSQGLKVGVNGPIPVIVVDQFGYPTTASKVAVIRDPQIGYDNIAHFTPGKIYAVVAKSTGETVKKGPPLPWNGGATDDISGDKVWWFDFSDIKTPGTYTIVDTEKGVRSVEFKIHDGVYRDVLRHAVRMFYYQRAGFKKNPETAGADWADAASHIGVGQDPQSRPWPGRREGVVRGLLSQLIKGDLVKGDASQIKDLRGGWYDAGDYNKYTNWTARNIIVLLRAYSENPNAFGDDTGIAESGNGIPDILDEVKWGLDWLVRMQNADGSVLCVQGLDEFNHSPPSTATGPSYYGPATTAASLMGAAAYAYAAKIYLARPEADLKSYASELANRAKSAWDWAAAHPSVLYFNNDNIRQPGSGGLASGQQEMDDSQRLFGKFEAAVYLYELTGDDGYRDFIESNYASIIVSGPTQWDANKQEALIYYAQLPGISADAKSAILKKFVANMTRNADQLPMVLNNKDPYRSPMRDYSWGSNMAKAYQARLYQLLAQFGSNAAITQKLDLVAMEYLHYIHGVNPLGLVYLTNMKSAGAKHSASTMFHRWFSPHNPRWARVTDTTPGPPPGYLVGGPNPAFSLDRCCTAASGTPEYKCHGSPDFSLCKENYVPPLGQPALKSYRDFNDDWPANSWEVSEPSTTYQAQYIRVLAKYVH